VKTKNLFTCQQCGYNSPKWLGKCPDCNEWNTFVEEQKVESKNHRSKATTDTVPLRLAEISNSDEDRCVTGLGEFDRVLGGGVVSGSLVLIGGDPGIGKSTLLLQSSGLLAQRGSVLYVTAEESARQVKMRAERLQVSPKDLFLLAETSLEAVIRQVQQLKPAFLIIDSIQTIFTGMLESAPGSVSQVRECSAQLMRLAKDKGIPTFLVGHVTKDGAIAGPRMLEHMVDTVLYFEGDPGHPYRILRAVKNRFGSTNEIGVFEMRAEGLREVTNPSALFLAERPEEASGSAVVAAMEGSRPLLVELQALVSSSAFGTPQRTSMGVDHKRVALLLAILEKKVGLSLAGEDIFVNVAGGLKLAEPAVDLGIVAALASSHLNRPLPAEMCFFGELGLTGEVRAVTHPELRLNEAARLGFKHCLLPAGSTKNLSCPKGITVTGIRKAEELLEHIFA